MKFLCNIHIKVYQIKKFTYTFLNALLNEYDDFELQNLDYDLE